MPGATWRSEVYELNALLPFLKGMSNLALTKIKQLAQIHSLLFLKTDGFIFMYMRALSAYLPACKKRASELTTW